MSSILIERRSSSSIPPAFLQEYLFRIDDGRGAFPVEKIRCYVGDVEFVDGVGRRGPFATYTSFSASMPSSW
jgi:hypothetical protein